VANSILGTGLPPYGILLMMMLILVVLGMFLDWVGILLLTVPIFLPIMTSLAFDGIFGLPGVPADKVGLWYGGIFMVNMQMAFLSPPFGHSLFYLKSVAPPHISMALIFPAAIPFLLLQAIGLALCIIFPQTPLWLPGLLYDVAPPGRGRRKREDGSARARVGRTRAACQLRLTVDSDRHRFVSPCDRTEATDAYVLCPRVPRARFTARAIPLRRTRVGRLPGTGRRTADSHVPRSGRSSRRHDSRRPQAGTGEDRRRIQRSGRRDRCERRLG